MMKVKMTKYWEYIQDGKLVDGTWCRFFRFLATNPIAFGDNVQIWQGFGKTFYSSRIGNFYLFTSSNSIYFAIAKEKQRKIYKLPGRENVVYYYYYYYYYFDLF
jgi:hypothetical protein